VTTKGISNKAPVWLFFVSSMIGGGFDGKKKQPELLLAPAAFV
jgi:hypothetical protein